MFLITKAFPPLLTNFLFFQIAQAVCTYWLLDLKAQKLRFALEIFFKMSCQVKNYSDHLDQYLAPPSTKFSLSQLNYRFKKSHRVYKFDLENRQFQKKVLIIQILADSLSFVKEKQVLWSCPRRSQFLVYLQKLQLKSQSFIYPLQKSLNGSHLLYNLKEDSTVILICVSFDILYLD